MYGPNFPMPSGYVWQYELIRWVQSFSTPGLDRIMKFMTYVGMEHFYLLALPIIFWGVHKRIGLRVTYVFLSSMYLNAWLKVFFHIVRPIGVPGIRSSDVATATGLSMPSGHAQGAMTFWGLLGKWIKRIWFWVLALLLVFLIGFSRLYLGLHWPLDILVGWLIGAVFAIGGWWVGRWWTYRNYDFSIQITLAAVIPVILLIIHRGSVSVSFATLLLGIGVGAVIEGNWWDFQMGTAWWRRVFAVVIGIGGVIALQWLIKWPEGTLWWTGTRNVLIGLWATLGAPHVFYRAGLYERKDVE